MEIPGIPESIPRARVTQAVRELGIDPTSIGKLELSGPVLYATVYAEKNGHRYFGSNTEPARHVIAIPIMDETSSADVGRSVVEAIKAYERGDGPQQGT